MGLELNIEVTEQELQYRSKYFHEIRAIEQRQWSCCSCGNVVSQVSARIYPHPIFGILQCECCNNNIKKISSSLKKKEAAGLCCICGRERNTLYGCKKQGCPYEFCKSCIKRNIPKSLVDAESGKWKCFVCNTEPLWKLRGACAAVMNSLPKRTKTKKVKSRNRSSDSEESTSDLRNISFVRRSRLEESKKLSKRLRGVCDEDSPTQQEESRPPLLFQQNKRTAKPKGNRARDLASSSEDSDLEVIEIQKPKITAKPERDKKIAKNGRTSTRRRSRNREVRKSDARLAVESSSDEDSDLEDRKHSRNSKLSEKMPSTRRSETVKGPTPSVFTKGKSHEDKKSKSRRESSEEEARISKSTEDSKSSASKSSKPSKRHSKDKSESESGGRKKPNDKSPGPKSFKAGKTPRREMSPVSEEDSDRSAASRPVENEEKRATHSDSENSEDPTIGKSVRRRLVEFQRQTSDSSSGKEFKKSKLLRSSFVALRRIRDIEEDLTTSPKESGGNNEVMISKDQIFYLKNSVNHFFSGMKKAATKLLSDIEIAQKNYSMKECMRVEEADSMVLESKKIASRFREIVDKGDGKFTDSYEKWCTKTKVRNVLKRKDGGERQSTSKSKVPNEDGEVASQAKIAESKKTASPKSTVTNGSNFVVVSECESDDIFSADETRLSINNRSNEAAPQKNYEKEKSVELTKKRESRNATPEISENVVAVSSDNEASIDKLVTSITPELPERLTDDEELPAASEKKSQDQTVPSGIQDFEEAMEIDDGSSDSVTADREARNVESEMPGGELPATQIAGEVENSITDGDIEGSKTTDEAPAIEKSAKVSAEENSQRKSSSKRASPVEAPKKLANDDSAAIEAENSESTAAKVLPVDEAEVESNVSGCDVASASTLYMSCSPEKLSDEKQTRRSTSPVLDISRSETKSAEDEAAEDSAEGQKRTKKNVDGPRRRVSARTSSLDTVLADEFEDANDQMASSGTTAESEAATSAESIEAQNARAKMALLQSSNSDDSSSESSTVRSTPKDSNNTPPTPPESDSKSDKSLTQKDSPERDGAEKLRKKRRKFRLTENRYYNADEQLKRKCVVRVEKLSETILRRYSRALKKSREHVESKNLKRLVALDNLEKDHKKVTSDGSGDEEKSSEDLRKNTAKARAAKEKADTLLDHLNKVENGEKVEVSNESDGESSSADNKKEELEDNNEDRLLIEANEMDKRRLLESSDSGADEEPVSETKDEETKPTKKAVKKEKQAKSSEDEEKKQEKSDSNRWRRNKALTSKISDSDSDEELKKYNLSQDKLKKMKEKEGSQSQSDEEESPKKKKKRVKRRVLHSDSDAQISSEKSDSDSDSSVQSIKKKKKKKGESSDDEKDKKKTRKRTKRRQSSDSSSSDERPKSTRRKRIKRTGSDSDSDKDVDSSPGKAGRKNIRKVIRDKQVAEDTKQAAKEEEERLKRIAERQKLYNEMYEVRLAGEEKVDKLVLDFDEETKEPLVSVDEGLVKRLKPHQAQGIKFMWDACFESVERIKSTKGSGCILAHCMGLGKTFQVVTLVHTLLTHTETGINTVLVVCPLSTVLNWANEFKIWLADIESGDDIEVYEMTKMKKNFERKLQLARWQETGGVMIIGYEMFRNLSQQSGKKVRKNIQETFLKCLVDPGPDLIVCDEGHLLKNEDTALSKAMRRVKTLRRVVLTGTPLQNNLIEYHCMVQFVKPNLLGTKKEFMNRFENPITNGQFDDSTEYDVKLMKKRAHILHKLLEGSVQRFDYSVLTPFLPPKQEYVIFVKLTKIQIDMYRHYLDNYARKHRGVGGSLFADFQALQRIWTHPMVMQMNAEKAERLNEKKRLDASDSEGSLRDFIDDGSDTPNSSDSSSENSGDEKTSGPNRKRGTRANPVIEEPAEASAAPEEVADESQWWSQFVKDEDFSDIRCSSKLIVLFRILKESEQIGDKLLVFSQSLYSLSLIERFLELIDEETQRGNELENLDGLSGSWALGLDYFRLDGQTSADNRRRWCEIFNKPSNTRARLFLISTRAGGLGINLTAANRVVIFDASWNPSHDVQSIFRIYRFGQKKPCYVYRLLAAGTMEEKIYNRQVTKLSLSCRVVDEQQIERHYSNNALAELYQLELPSEDERTLNLPKDRLLAEILLKYRKVVENYHEHDSLLENQAGEELDEEERKEAWIEYEEEKKGKRMLPPVQFPNYNDPLLAQQINLLQRLISKDYPNISEAQQKIMASRSMYEMYSYVEKQAMAGQGNLQMANALAQSGAYNAQAVNQGANYYRDLMHMQQQQQQQQPALMQQHNGQMMYANTPQQQQQLRADIFRQQQQQLQYAQQSRLHGQPSSITIDDDDVMEVIPAPEKNVVPPAPAPEVSPKSKEE